MATINDRHNPSFILLPVNNNRTAWRPFGLPVVMVVPHRRTVNGDTISGSHAFNVKIYIEDVPREARVAGHDNIGKRSPDRELYAEYLSSLELSDKYIDTDDHAFYDSNGNVIEKEDARGGSTFAFTTTSGVIDSIPYYPDADYYDLSDVLIDMELLPVDRYNLVYETEYFARVVSQDELQEFLCIDTSRVATARLKFKVNHPGELINEFYNLTPPPYLTNASKSLDSTVALYRPFTDLLQDIYDEQELLEQVNWVFETPPEAIPYISSLLGWELPYFPQSLDALRKAVLRRTVEFQNLAGSRRAIINVFRLFGFEILISNLWWSSDGKRFIRPGENLPAPYKNQEIEIADICQIDLVYNNYTQAGFTEASVPLLFRPQVKATFGDFSAVRDGGDLTIEAYLVTKGSDAHLALQDIANAISSDPEDFGAAEGCFVDDHGFINSTTISNTMGNLDVDGFSQILISGKLGLPTNEVLVGDPPITQKTVKFNRETNMLDVTINGYFNSTTQAIYIFANYERQKIIVPNIIEDLQSNRFDIQVLTQSFAEFADPTTLEFALEFLNRLKAFHSLLNLIRTRIELTETYEVTDWCVPPETMITMADGTARRIDSLNENDLVIGEDGKQHKILKVKKRLVSENINRIQAVGVGDNLLITNEHPLLIAKFENVGKIKYKNHPHRSSIKYKTIIKNDFEWLSANSVNPNDLAYGPLVKFDIQPTKLTDTEIEFLGYYTAEGDSSISTCCVRFSIGEHEEEFANRIQQLGLLLHASSVNTTNNGRGSKIIEVYGKHLVELCQKIIPGKAVDKYLTEEILSLDIVKFKHFLLSYVRGDGSYSGGTSDRIQCTSASRNLIEQFYWKLTSLNINCTKWYGVQKGGPGNRDTECYQYRITLPKNSYDQLISNKSNSISKLRHWVCDDNIAIKIKKISKEFYSGYVYNLEVEDSNTYIANGLVVHNCVGGDSVMRYDTDAGRLQVPPAIIPDIPGAINDCTLLDPINLGYKESDLLLRLRKLANLPEEHEAWRILDNRSSDFASGLSLSPMQPGEGRSECKYTYQGQDRIVGSRAEARDIEYGPGPNASRQIAANPENPKASPSDSADNGVYDTTGAIVSTNSNSGAYSSFNREFTEIRTSLCNQNSNEDFCYKGRVDDELLFRSTLLDTDHPRMKPCSLGMGTGTYYLYPSYTTIIVPGTKKPCRSSKTEVIQFSGKSPEGNKRFFLDGILSEYLTANYDKPLNSKQNSHLGQLYRSYGTPTTQTLHYNNRRGMPLADQRHNLALERPSLVIEKPTMHLPGCAFIFMNQLEEDFEHDTWEARPWDDLYSTHCGPKHVCGNGEPSFLNVSFVEDINGDEMLVFDAVPFKILGNGLIPLLKTFGGDISIDAADIVHAVYMATCNDSPYVTLDQVEDFSPAKVENLAPVGYITTNEPLFNSHNVCGTGGYLDFADGYPSSRGEFAVGKQEFDAYFEDWKDVLNALGLPRIATKADISCKFGSGVLDASVQTLRFDCGCLLAGCDGTVSLDEDTICSADTFIDEDGNYDWEPDHLSLELRMKFNETIGTCSAQLNGSIPSFLEVI